MRLLESEFKRLHVEVGREHNGTDLAKDYPYQPNDFSEYDEPFHGGHHHEYSIEEFKGVFHKSGFLEEEFILYEEHLRSQVCYGLNDLQSRNRLEGKRRSQGEYDLR